MAQVEINKILLDELEGPFGTFTIDSCSELQQIHKRFYNSTYFLDEHIDGLEHIKEGVDSDVWDMLLKEGYEELIEIAQKYEEEYLIRLTAKLQQEINETMNFVSVNEFLSDDKRYFYGFEMLLEETVERFMANQGIIITKDEREYLAKRWEDTWSHNIEQY